MGKSLRLTERGGYYYVNGTYKSHRIRKTTGVKADPANRAEALEELKRIKKEIDSGSGRASPAGARLTFEKIAEEYLARPEGVNKNDRLTIERFVARFGRRTLDELTSGFIEQYVRDWHRGHKPGTVKRQLNLLRAVLRRAWRMGHIDIMPHFPMPRVDDERHAYYTEAERDAILDACTGDLAHLHIFCLVSFYTGARPNEVARLEWGQVNLRRNEITFSSKKGMRTRRRTVPIHPKLKDALLALPHRTGHVCLNKKGGPWAVGDSQRPAIQKPFAEACARAGVKSVRPYDMRHTYGSHLYLKGVDPIRIMDLMGHSNLNQTRRYTHVAAATMLHDAVGRLT